MNNKSDYLFKEWTYSTHVVKHVTANLFIIHDSVMNGLIDERQSAFIKGRHILHGIVILNEVVEEARRKRKPVMIFKVDFEKAYDSVSWSFLDYMLFMLFCSCESIVGRGLP